MDEKQRHHTRNAMNVRGRLLSYLTLWPLFGLLAVEILAFGFVAGIVRLPITSSTSLLIGASILLTGLLPALLRPNSVSMLTGCFFVMLAGILLISTDQDREIPTQILSLINIVGLSTLALHSIVRFTSRKAWVIPILLGGHSITILLVTATYFVPIAGAEAAISGLLTLWIVILCVLALPLIINTQSDRTLQAWRMEPHVRPVLICFIISGSIAILSSIGNLFDFNISIELILASQILLPLSVVYAIYRYDLFGIDAVLRRACIYALVSIILLVVYFGLTAALTILLTNVISQSRIVVTIMGLLLAAVAFEPLYIRIQNVIDQLFYRERVAFRHELVSAREQLSSVTQRKQVIHLLVDELPERLGATWAQITFLPDHLQSLPADLTRAWNAPLIVGGATLGHYWLGPRRVGVRYDSDEQAQLQAFTQHVALALAYADTFDAFSRLNHDLEERVAARTEHMLAQQRALIVMEERQHLARYLHDSVTQSIFSVGLNLCTVRTLIPLDQVAAISLLSDQEATVQQALEEMRTLLTQLRSPTMHSHDFVQTLNLHCALLKRQNGLDVSLDTPPSLKLPEEISRELLYVVKEALHNTVKHSGTSLAQITLASDNESLVLQIADHGFGFDPTNTTRYSKEGFGICGMRERITALGGTFTIQSAPNEGTIINVKVARST